MRSFVTVGLCLPLALAWGCHGKSSEQETAADKDRALRAELVGLWVCAWDLGPVGYQREMKPDGSLVMREFRGTAAATASAPAEDVSAMYHPVYKVNLRRYREDSGSWTVEKGNLIFTISLSNGDPMRLCYKIDRVSSTELVLSSAGVEGKAETKFQRKR